MANIKILGIAGSLRKGSYNMAALRAAEELLPPDAELEILELGEIPMFNQDLEGNMPQAVKELKASIKAADAILFSTPEYNYSIPGVLKNAIDWASRPHTDNSWAGKPVAIMSASNGTIGGERAQLHLRQTFVYLDMHPVNKPEVVITFVSQKIDNEGNLTDVQTREKIKELLASLVALTKRLKA